MTPPLGEIINGNPVTHVLDPGEERSTFGAEWAPGQYAAAYDRRWTVGELLSFQPGQYQDVGGYASYEVTVRLDGKARTYRALALFHDRYSDAVDRKVEFWDSIVSLAGYLTDVWRDSRAVLDPATVAYGESGNVANGAGRQATDDFVDPPVLRFKTNRINHNSGYHAGNAYFQNKCSTVEGICLPSEVMDARSRVAQHLPEGIHC